MDVGVKIYWKRLQGGFFLNKVSRVKVFTRRISVGNTALGIPANLHCEATGGVTVIAEIPARFLKTYQTSAEKLSYVRKTS